VEKRAQELEGERRRIWDSLARPGRGPEHRRPAPRGARSPSEAQEIARVPPPVRFPSCGRFSPMRIFVLGAGATGSLLAQMLHHQGHEVSCGDRDAERARRFFSKKSEIPIAEVNARNLWGIVKAARRCQLLINASPAVYNEIILRAALRLKAHYLDMAAHLTRNPFRAEQLRYAKRFEAKNRAAVINAGIAPGLTNLLVRRAEEMLDEVE